MLEQAEGAGILGACKTGSWGSKELPSVVSSGTRMDLLENGGRGEGGQHPSG